MAGGPISSAPDRPTDLFISYSPADERWATWVAWALEGAGYRTMLQAWDFVPGTNFIDFMDRGIRESAAMIAILSRNYLKSRYGRWEWQSAIRADPDNPANKLVTIRVDECPLEGLLSTITYVDLVGVTDPDEARALLMARIRHALAGRAKPGAGPDFPNAPARAPGTPATVLEAAMPPLGPRAGARVTPFTGASGERPRRRQVTRLRDAAAAQPRPVLSLLHVPGPRFGRGLTGTGEPVGAAELQARIWADVTQLIDSGRGKTGASRGHRRHHRVRAGCARPKRR